MLFGESSTFWRRLEPNGHHDADRPTRKQDAFDNYQLF